MMVKWMIVKIKCKICGALGLDEEIVKRKYFLKKGMVIGDNCCIYSDISTPESYLVSIGSNVTVSNDVQLLTHDNSIDRLCLEKCDIFGEIKIGNNCFVGAHTTILPGVTLGDFVVVGAGSVVTKSFPDGVIIAGNPARQIGTVDVFLDKYLEVAFGPEDFINGKRKGIQEHQEKVIKNR